MTRWTGAYCFDTGLWKRLLCLIFGHVPFRETTRTIYCLRCGRVGERVDP